MKVILTALTILISLSSFAQSGYVDRLKDKKAHEGNVVFHQDSKIKRLLESDSAFVNLKPKTESMISDKVLSNINKSLQGLNGKTPNQQTADSIVKSDSSVNVNVPTRRYKVEGFRIQIYAGNNSRKSRIEATRASQKIKSYFPELSVYTHFYPPRWICRVGDFRTAEEAAVYLSHIRDLKDFTGVTLIKTMIQVTY